MTARLRLMMITGDPEIARFVSDHGIDWVMVDLETLGKHDRQSHVASWKSTHTRADVSRVRDAAPGTTLMVRLNPLNPGSAEEVEDALARGADSLMLPMFRSAEEVARFFDMVADRALVAPLFETAAALAALPEILAAVPLAEAHIGLNDLHLDLGQRFMFEPLADGTLETPCRLLRERGVAFGIGGVARAREGIVSPDYLLGEHVRLGSSGAILSRTFHRNAETLDELRERTDFGAEVARLRAIYDDFAHADAAAIEANRRATADRIHDVVRLIEAR